MLLMVPLFYLILDALKIVVDKDDHSIRYEAVYCLMFHCSGTLCQFQKNAKLSIQHFFTVPVDCQVVFM